MRPRTAQKIASIGALIGIGLVILWVLSLLSACVAQPKPPPHADTTSGLPDAVGGILEAATPSDPTQAAATQSLWPFTWVGALCLLAGVVWVILFKQPLVLILGAVLAAVPFIVLYTSKAFLIPVAIGVAVIGLVTLGAAAGRWLGWWDWSRKTDLRAQYLRDRITDQQVPPDQVNLTGEVARALEWVGRRQFDPLARDLPHHQRDPLLVEINNQEPTA